VSVFSPAEVTFLSRESTGRMLYRVDLPVAAYDGLVRVSAARHAAGDADRWIAEQLSQQSRRFGMQVICAALYRPLELDG
jgi:hypothetical protein